VTKAHISIPELTDALKEGKMVADGKIMLPTGHVFVTKAALDPVWYLPAVAERLGVKVRTRFSLSSVVLSFQHQCHTLGARS